MRHSTTCRLWRPKTSQALAFRCRIVLAAAEGATSTEIAFDGRDPEIYRKMRGSSHSYYKKLQAIENIKSALERAGALLEDVVRTRVYVTDPEHFEGVARAHGEVFSEIRPVNTTVVTSLMEPAWKVEIDVDAVLP